MRLNPKSKMKTIQFMNLKIFKRQDNRDMSFKLTAMEKNNPFTIIPTKVYQDFDRKNFKRHTIKFPIVIPVWQRTVYAPKEAERAIRQLPNEVNYSYLTGNQLLLTLLKYDDLTSEEFSEVFFNLARKQNAKALQLENNELVKPAIAHFIKNVDMWTVDHATRTIFALYELGFEDQALWSKARKLFMDKKFAFEKISSTYFSQMYIIFWDKFKEDMTSEEREYLVDQLPRYLKKMKPEFVIKMFEIAVEHQLITSRTDYLFDRHFFMILWKRPGMLGLNGFRRAIACIKKLRVVTEDQDFVVNEMLPVVEKLIVRSTDNNELNELIKELDGLADYGVDSSVVEKYSGMAFQRLMFIETKLKVLKQTEFIEIVKSDLKKFRIQKLQALQKKSLKLTADESKPIPEVATPVSM